LAGIVAFTTPRLNVWLPDGVSIRALRSAIAADISSGSCFEY
jgi:hypothetical protein